MLEIKAEKFSNFIILIKMIRKIMNKDINLSIYPTRFGDRPYGTTCYRKGLK